MSNFFIKHKLLISRFLIIPVVATTVFASTIFISPTIEDLTGYQTVEEVNAEVAISTVVFIGAVLVACGVTFASQEQETHLISNFMESDFFKNVKDSIMALILTLHIGRPFELPKAILDAFNDFLKQESVTDEYGNSHLPISVPLIKWSGMEFEHVMLTRFFYDESSKLVFDNTDRPDTFYSTDMDNMRFLNTAFTMPGSDWALNSEFIWSVPETKFEFNSIDGSQNFCHERCKFVYDEKTDKIYLSRYMVSSKRYSDLNDMYSFVVNGYAFCKTQGSRPRGYYTLSEIRNLDFPDECKPLLCLYGHFASGINKDIPVQFISGWVPFDDSVGDGLATSVNAIKLNSTYMPYYDGSTALTTETPLTIPQSVADSGTVVDTPISDVRGDVTDVPTDKPGTDTGIGATVGGILGLLQGLWEWAKNLVGNLTGALSGLLTGLFDLVIGAINAIASPIIDVLTGFWDWCKDLFGEPKDLDIDFSKLRLDGLTKVFPFCLPFDFVKMLKMFVGTPSFKYQIKLDTSYFKVNHTVDLEPFKIVFGIFRTFVLVYFTYFLISKSKDLIKW